MVNIKYTVSKDDILTITVDLKERHGPSDSGKTTIIAKTGPSVDVKPGIKMGLNVYTKDK